MKALLITLLVMYLVNVLGFALLISLAEYPRHQSFSRGADMLRLLGYFAFAVWVSYLLWR